MNTKYTTLIERYFDQQLSHEELSEVERLRKIDSAFKEEFDLFEKAQQAVRLSTIINLKAEIKEIHQNMDAPPKPLLFTLQRMGIAASILFLVGLGIYAQQYSNENIYNETYTPVGDYITNMNGEFSEMEKAMELFDKEDFDGAGDAFDRVYAETGDQVALFYSGHSHFQAGKTKDAIQKWSKISNNYQSEANWYIGLAYLKIGEVDATRKTLHVIIEDNEDQAFVLKAKKLESQLSSPFRKLAF